MVLNRPSQSVSCKKMFTMDFRKRVKYYSTDRHDAGKYFMDDNPSKKVRNEAAMENTLDER